MNGFYFLRRNINFGETTKAIVQKMVFLDKVWNLTILCYDVRQYILKLHSKNQCHSVISFHYNYELVSYVLWNIYMYMYVPGVAST